MTEPIEMLAAEFPKESVHWRAQSVKRDGSAAMALAYIDARDVMDRLDTAVGPDNWQDEYCETARGRVICKLSIRIGEQWITKSDGAGDTAVEGEKGGLSDAFKRAAVKWGVGRYLYDMPTPWVPCESYEKNGCPHWKKWTADPWSCVNRREPPKQENSVERPQKISPEQLSEITALIDATPGVTSQDVVNMLRKIDPEANAVTDMVAADFEAGKKWITKNAKQAA